MEPGAGAMQVPVDPSFITSTACTNFKLVYRQQTKGSSKASSQITLTRSFASTDPKL
jgi:hypothetical protein